MNSIRRVLSSIKKSDYDFNLVNDNDKVVIYVDGSKSSIALAKAFEVYPFYSKKKIKTFLVAFDYGFNKSLIDEIKNIYPSINVIDGTDIVTMVNAKGKDASTSAFLKLERKLLVMFAKDVKAKKIALSSTHEDSLEYLYRSIMNEGKITTLRPKSSVYECNVSFIRPLIYCYDSDVDKLIDELQITLPESNNPWVKGREESFAKVYELIQSYRNDSKDMLKKALSDEHPTLYKDSKEWNVNGYILRKDIISVKEFTKYNIFKNKENIGYISYLFIDHHLVKIAYSKLDCNILIPCLDKIIGEFLDDIGKLTIYFNRPNNTIVDHCSLKKMNVRGKIKFATRITK